LNPRAALIKDFYIVIGFKLDLMSFIHHFDSLEDTCSHINKKHERLEIVFLTVEAILSGAEGERH